MPTPGTPPANITMPVAPDRADRPTFNARATAFADALKNILPPYISSALVYIQTTALGVFGDATTASSAATNAMNASSVAVASANFKGLWPSLSGALNKPASVKHNGKFWLLLNNLSNVAASEPGVSADWTSLDATDLTTISPLTALTLMNQGIR